MKLLNDIKFYEIENEDFPLLMFKTQNRRNFCKQII